MQAKEYQELFPPTCFKSDPESSETPDLNAAIMNALSELRADISPADQVSQKETNGGAFESTLSTRNGTVAKNPLGVRGVDAVQVSIHRGPPTDRPPDRPCTCIGVVRGCLQERADTRHASQVAFFARVGHSLSGNATPLQTIAIKRVWTPSDCHASSQAGSSQQSFTKIRSRAGSFCPVRGTGSMDTCVASSHPSYTCGRNLFLRGGFSHWRIQRRSMAQRDNRRLGCTSPRPGLRAVVRCSQAPRWGQTK
jgi:hypothetical protein